MGPGRQRAGEREVRGGLKRSRPGRAEEPAGPRRWASAGEGMGRLGRGERVGRRVDDGLGWVGWFGLGFSSIPFPLSFLFLNQTKFEFKYKFEFNPHSNN